VPTLSPAVYQWATRHRVSLQALQELQALFGMHGGHDLPATVKGTSEAAVQAAVRLEAARKGVRLFRNNVGALIDSRGVPVRYGLANESKQVNEVMKSADLIGWRPVLIGPQHVGQVIGQFVSRECKKVGWQYTGDARELAQLAWAQLVTASGGDAAFCTGEGTL
jgi:hypothetical protein